MDPFAAPLEGAQLAEFEAFVEGRLKVDLRKVLLLRDRTQAALAHYVVLASNIRLLLQQDVRAFTSLVNLGSEFYSHARVEDTSRIYVNVGLGFHVEYTLEEALRVVALKEADLTRQTEDLTRQASKISAHIAAMYEGMARFKELS